MNISTIFTDKVILIPGGSGSWGNELTKQLLYFNPKKIIIFSRGEIAQVAMQRKFKDPRLEFIIGDVRDKDVVGRLFYDRQIDYIFYLAALKHVPICENQPLEAVKTNIIGLSNFIECTIHNRCISKFILVSTDKAVDPINVYGMTKGIAERMIIEANVRSRKTEFLCVRAGNVLGTNGSLVPMLINQLKNGEQLTLTNEKMTRYFFTISKAVSLLFFAAENGIGGEVYVMNMPSFYIKDLFELLAGKNKIKIIGEREGEKIHETLISPHEINRVHIANEDYFVLYPMIETGKNYSHLWNHYDFVIFNKRTSFTSLDNLRTKEQLKELLQEAGYL